MPRAVTRPASAYGTLANLEERVVKQSVLLAVSQVRGDKGPSLGPAEAEIWKAIPPSAETPKGESEPDLDLVWICSSVPSHLSSPGILKLWTWIQWFQNDQDLTCLEVTNKIIPGEEMILHHKLLLYLFCQTHGHNQSCHIHARHQEHKEVTCSRNFPKVTWDVGIIRHKTAMFTVF